MEVHHHSHAAHGKKKWTHYFWEFLMLFLAVFCGFLAENKREHIVEQHRAKDYARMMKLDLVNDTVELGNFIRKNDSLKTIYNKVYKIIEKEHAVVTFEDFYFLKRAEIGLVVFVPHDGTYNQMKYSGNLRYFTKKELIEKLIFYESQQKHFFDLWNTSRQVYGGFNSEHFLTYSIISDRFLKKYRGENLSKPIQSFGYDFSSWDQSGKIFSHITNVYTTILNDSIYPTLYRTASEIITELTKEYHLK